MNRQCFGDPDPVTRQVTPPDGFALLDGDCNDSDSSINPGAIEIPKDGIDNDCDASTFDCDTIPTNCSVNLEIADFCNDTCLFAQRLKNCCNSDQIFINDGMQITYFARDTRCSGGAGYTNNYGSPGKPIWLGIKCNSEENCSSFGDDCGCWFPTESNSCSTIKPTRYGKQCAGNLSWSENRDGLPLANCSQ